jgi:hypothetical protein
MAGVKEEERAMAAEVKPIPINLIEPHPQIASRFDYRVEPLAVLIKSCVDEGTPNGQLQPGWVVPREDGKGFYVYIGVRRYFALKALREETGDERFAVFNAYVDDKHRSLLDLLRRARRENEEGKGERLALSVLEQAFGLYKIRGSVSSAELDDGLKSEFAVAEKLNEEKLRKLFEVEAAAHFGFTLEHLERLSEIEDEKEFYLSAACAAGYAVGPERMERAIEGKEAAHTLKWFGNVFPQYRKGSEKAQAGVEPAAGATEQEGGEKGAAATTNRQPLEVHEKEVIIVPCPACGQENMMQLHLKAEVTRLPADPNGESVTAVPDVVAVCDCGCSHCPREFHVFIKPLGGRRYAVEASLSRRFREPKEAVEAVGLRVDLEQNVWQKIVEDEVVGVARTRSRTK